MIKPKSVRQLPECTSCRFYCGNPYLFCAVVPDGPEGETCPYFAPDLDTQETELWEPQGARYINDEPSYERITYGVKQAPQRLTTEQQLYLLDNHPLFTGKCSECGHIFNRDYTVLIHFDCPECGWIDDSI
jgi:hypothetical protein